MRTISSNIAKGTCVTPPSASSKASVVNDFSPAVPYTDKVRGSHVDARALAGRRGLRTAAESARVGHSAAAAALLPDPDLDAQPEPHTSNTATHQPRKTFLGDVLDCQASGAHVLFLWLNLRSPEWPFLPRCMLNFMRALIDVILLKFW